MKPVDADSELELLLFLLPFLARSFLVALDQLVADPRQWPSEFGSLAAVVSSLFFQVVARLVFVMLVNLHHPALKTHCLV